MKTEYPNSPKVGVGALVFKNRRVLLVKRGKEPSKGVWAIPGGSVELGETLQKAAQREIFDETGITIRAGNPILTFDTIERDAMGAVRFHYVIVDLAADYVSGEPIPGDDAKEAGWFSAEKLKSIKLNPKTEALLAGCSEFKKW